MSLRSYENAIAVGAIHERDGQYAYNLLHHIHPQLARQVVGTPLDPFHNDEKLPEFLVWVEENWPDE